MNNNSYLRTWNSSEH